jgi:glucosylglycerate phosphorylase
MNPNPQVSRPEPNASARDTARELLESLYGLSSVQDIERRLSELIARFAPELGRTVLRDLPSSLSQRDVLLITYADQLHKNGEAPLQVLAEFCVRHLKGTVSGVHLLPFYPWSSDDGFSVKDFFEVDPIYGTWEDVRRLGTDFDLMFDAVFNHVSAHGKWFQRFLADDPSYRDFFISVAGNPNLSQVVRPRALPLLTEFSTAAGPKQVWTTFSADQVDLNFKNPEVLLAAVEALLFYVARGARFIRLDAIAFLWKEIGTTCLHLPQTHQIIQLLHAVLDETAPHVQLITETNVPHAENLSYFGDGTNEAQLVYNFALPPLVLHSMTTGDARKLAHWAQSLALPSDRATFFNFLASHDGIGLNPVRGILSEVEIEALVGRTLEHGGVISYKEMPDGSRLPYELNINYLDALSNPAKKEISDLVVRKFLTAHAILLCLQGVPGIYFHSMFGSRGDRASAEVSAIPRRINRQKFETSLLEAELNDVRLLRAMVFAGQCELLRIRRQHPAFAPGARQHVLECDSRVFALLRQSQDGTDTVLCLQNVSPESVVVRLEGILPKTLGLKSLWGDIRSTDSSGLLAIGPWGSSWLAAVRCSK